MALPGPHALAGMREAAVPCAATLSHALPVMADTSSGNTASVAIVVLVILAIAAAAWFFMNGSFGSGGGDKDINVKIEGPSGQ